ncbi:thiosulfate sulfurtransferase GlpE [Azonexus sp.]|uniref:thiosulfate sulfurtransferase GlpE n=1 Tax=Azonexus sp. TaxID=1872668 RepID=UPI0035B0EF45
MRQEIALRQAVQAPARLCPGWRRSCLIQALQLPVERMLPRESLSYQCISPASAAAMIRSDAAATVFDVRDLASYRQGHLDGAVHLQMERVAAWLGRLSRETPLIIYCYHGNASQVYAQMFCDFRFSRVYSVDGGYERLAAALAG